MLPTQVFYALIANTTSDLSNLAGRCGLYQHFSHGLDSAFEAQKAVLEQGTEGELAFCSVAASMSSIAFKAYLPCSPRSWRRFFVTPSRRNRRKAALVEEANARDPAEPMF